MISEGMRDRARSLRVEATPFEQSFWQRVRAGRLGGFKFRRQQVMGGYIVDFVCQAARLVVELDGSQHQDAGEYDRERDAWLRAQGYRVLRVWNNEWVANPEGVLERVWGMLHAPFAEPHRPSPQFEQPSPQPLPPNGGGALHPSPLGGQGLGERVLAPLSHLGRGAGGEGESSDEVEG